MHSTSGEVERVRSNSFESFITAEGLPILGRVSMDYIVLESTKDEVCIFDNALSTSRQLKTISYEVTTQLHEKLERTVGCFPLKTPSKLK